LRGVLSVCDFAPSLREQLLSLVFSKLIQIDSEITLDDEEEEANPEGGALTDMLFSMDLDGAIGGTPSSQHGGAEKTSSNADLAEKLDVLMDTMFWYYLPFSLYSQPTFIISISATLNPPLKVPTVRIVSPFC
jgi:RNA polymerase I specific transcription initiation factor RRN3.